MSTPSLRFCDLRKARFIACAVVTALLLGLHSAAVAQVTGSGKISGLVRNKDTGAFLEGVEVTVPAAHLRTLTDREGAFALINVPVGSQTVQFYYTGLEIATKTVDVTSGLTADASMTLKSDVQQLEAFTVSTSRVGEAASVTKQRNADNIMNVVSTEAFGNVADGNIGNFMVRLPGISADYENGEVLGIKIRGTPPEFSAVNVDGTRTAGASVGNTGGDRSAEIDTIPAEFIKEVEVIKASRPDMPADSIGGTTNLITKSALDFERDVLTYRAGINYNGYRHDSRSTTPNAALTYMTRLGAKRDIGLAVSLTYTDTEAPRDRVQMTRDQSDGRNAQARTLSNVNGRIRIGAGMKFDYRVSDRLTVYAKLNYNYYDFKSPRDVLAISTTNEAVADYSVVSRAQIEAGTAPRTSTNTTAFIAPGYTDSYTEMLAATFTHQVTNNIRRFRNYTGEVGGTLQLDSTQKLTFQASYNPSKASGNLRAVNFNYVGAPFGFSVDTRDNRSRPQFRQTYGPTIGFGSDFSAYTATFQFAPEDHVEDDVDNAKLDYTKNFRETRWPIEIKSGVNWREQKHVAISRAPTWNYVGPDKVAGKNPTTGINDDNLAQFRSTQPEYTVFNNGGVWPNMDGIDFYSFFNMFNTHPEYFTPSGTSVSTPPTYRDIKEDVSAAYVQGKLQFAKTTLLGGVRFERTDLDAIGTYTDSKNPTVTLSNRKADYQDYFPSVHLRQEFIRGLIARASFSTGAARPNMSDLYPSTSVSYSATTGLGTVTQPNPGLKAEYSKNYDVSLEYYFEPAGVISIGGFRKDIRDFLSKNTAIIGNGPDNGFNGDYAGFNLSTTTNLGSAKIEGVEANVSQQLTFLPKPFNSVRIFGNMTRLRTSGTYASGATDLVGFVPKTANAGFSFRWRKAEFRTAWNYQGTTLRTYSATLYAQQRSRPVQTVDINIKYDLFAHTSLFIDFINIHNKWQELYSGNDPQRVIISDSYGSRCNIGISGRF